MTLVVTTVRLALKSFQNDFKRLPRNLRDEASSRIAELKTNPHAGRLRLHKLDGYKPGVYTIDLCSGKGKRYKAAFRLEGSVAVFLRAGTHKEIDRIYP